MICNVPRRSAGFISSLQRWKLLGFKNKRTVTKKKKSPWYVQDDSGRLFESLVYPFINPNKQVDSAALNQCIAEPLSFEFEKTDGIDGSRLYQQKFPSVTTVLDHTKPANEFFALRNWKKAQITEHGEEKFKELSQNVKQRGSDFHQDMHTYLSSLKTQEAVIKPMTSPHWESVQHVLEGLDNIVAVESSVIHPLLGYAGTLDLVAQYDGKLCVIDWKTSQKRKTKLEECFSYPQQIAAYAGAVNHSDLYPFQVHHGMIVIAYKNGDPADVVMISPEKCEEYWDIWLMRLGEYKLRFPDVESRDQATFGAKEDIVCEHSDKGNEATLFRDVESRDQASFSVKGSVVCENSDKGNETTSRILRPQTLRSMGTPLKHLGNVLRDEDLIPKRTIWERIKEIFSPLASAEGLAEWKAFLRGIVKKERKS